MRRLPATAVRQAGGAAHALWIGALLAAPALLFAPILYYSLDSPFSLTSDYSHWRQLRVFESPSSFLAWLEWVVGMDEVESRYRPAWQIYNAVVWNWFGANASAHHLLRWIVHFGAVAFFCAAFCRICAIRTAESLGRAGHLLPLALLVHVWLFFPNAPAVRLDTQETLTVFFLGLCNYAAAIALSWESQRRASPTSLRKVPWYWLYGLFFLGFLGLTFSKEVNFALSLSLLVAYFAWICLTKAGWRAVLAGVPLVAAVALMVARVYAATENFGTGYGNAYSAYTSVANVAKMLLGLFQVHTSVVVAAGFAVLLGALAFGRVATGLYTLGRALKTRKNGGETGGLVGAAAADCELAFVLLLVGQFVCMFGVLAASWGVVLRYWYPLVVLLSVLLAFGAKWLMEAGRRRGWSVRRMAVPLVAFVVFYVACNYYNFAFQTIAWHSLSTAEDALIEEVRRLGDRGEHVVVEGTAIEHECSLIHRVGNFLAHFRGMDFTVHVAPPESGRPYYFVTQQELPHQEKATTIASQREHRLLTAASAVASVLQLRREPFQQLDAGVSWHRDGKPYVWNIYRLPASDAGVSSLPVGPAKPCT